MSRIKKVYEVWVTYMRSGPCKVKITNGKKSVFTTKREAQREVKQLRSSCSVKSAKIKVRAIK